MKSYFSHWPYQQHAGRGKGLFSSLLIASCVCTLIYDVAEIWGKSWPEKLLSLPMLLSRKRNEEVHRTSQIIWNISVAQINSRTLLRCECWRYLSDIKMPFFTRPYHTPLVVVARPFSFLFLRCVNLQINNIKHEISWGSLCFLPCCCSSRCPARNTISRLWCTSRSYFSAITVFEMLRMYRQPPRALFRSCWKLEFAISCFAQVFNADRDGAKEIWWKGVKLWWWWILKLISSVKRGSARKCF